MNIKIILLLLLLLNTLHANTCTSKQMEKMVKKGISSEDISAICETKKDETSDNSYLSNRQLFLQHEGGSLDINNYTIDFEGFSIGSAREYKNHLFSSIYKPLSIKTKSRGISIYNEMNTFKFKYGYKISMKKNIIILPKIIFTSVDIDNSPKIYSLMTVIGASIEYTKGNYLSLSYVLGGMRNIKTVSSVFAVYSEDTVSGMLAIEAKHRLSDKLVINGLYKRYKNDTRGNNIVTDTSMGIGAKYKIYPKIYTKIMLEFMSYSSSRSNVSDLDGDRVTFRVGYKL